ncbi:MAG: hypothetical protein IPF47_13700 [Gemmatimonadetes bacterium]|nr:hypothetical protein [Gemmatimonadota bacterium]
MQALRFAVDRARGAGVRARLGSGNEALERIEPREDRPFALRATTAAVVEPRHRQSADGQ